MPVAFIGRADEDGRDRLVREALERNGYQCTDSSVLLFDDSLDLESLIRSSDVFICYGYAIGENPRIASLVGTAEMDAALYIGIPFVVVRTGPYQDRVDGGDSISDLRVKHRHGNVLLFDMFDGKTADDLPRFLKKAAGVRGKGHSIPWFTEQREPAPPYEGDRDYLYFSFAENDRFEAYGIIGAMQDAGFRIGYRREPVADDRGEQIAEQIMNCCCLIALISPDYIQSEECKDEISLARDLNKERLLVYLKETRLSPGMAMRFLRLQAIHKYTYKTRKEFYDKLFSAKGIHAAKE